VRVVVADDSALIRDGLGRLLPTHGFTVTGVAADVPGLLAAVDATHPDVALVDIRMPPGFRDEGIAAARVIRERHPGVGVLVLSQHVEPAYALALLELGCGFVLKDRVTEVAILAEAIRRAGRGEAVVDPEVVALLLNRCPLAELTAREREVLALVAEGLTDRGIAERLWVTPKTVQTHVRHILAKLRLPADAAHNRRVLAVLAYLREAGGGPQTAPTPPATA
jgi:DNA-binding NarL/FixJ family response regulator